MTVYHVTTLKKLNKYLKTGYIKPPLRVLGTHRTSRKNEQIYRKKNNTEIIIPNNRPKCEGHFNQARILYEPYILESI